VPTLDSRIDDLYKGPLKEFVARRAALAKTLTGDQARRVKALPKPTVVPWAVNQLFWEARPAYDRLVSTGEKLRAAQIDALKGRTADVRRATDAHRKALADAVTEALRLASAAGAHPSPDDLTKTLEAVSVARDLPEQQGRLTKVLRPAGFEALAGVPLKELAPAPAVSRAAGTSGPTLVPTLVAKSKSAPGKREAEERRRIQAEQRRHKKATEQAMKALTRAKAEEARVRTAWERAKRKVAAAELAVSTLGQRDDVKSG
jgi:hypothetical protein